jgi:alkylhydroperoxidase/carboxymuconolactone decarboxylase family protein YurZ
MKNQPLSYTRSGQASPLSARLQISGIEPVQMNFLVPALTALSFLISLPSRAESADITAPTISDVGAVSPALEQYSRDTLFDGLWNRPELSPRDRSIITISVFITRDQTAALQAYLRVALDSGVKPSEISEIITHLAFYAGWGNALSAAPATKDVFAQRGIGADQMPGASPQLLPLDQAAEDQRATRVGEQFGAVAPELVQNTTDILFRDLWLRPGLAPREQPGHRECADRLRAGCADPLSPQQGHG